MARKKTNPEVIEEAKDVVVEEVKEEKPKKAAKQPKKCGTVAGN